MKGLEDLRIATKHGTQAHARPKIPHQFYRTQVLQPFLVVEDVPFSTDELRVLVLDPQAFHVGPQLLQLVLYALHVHRLHVLALPRTSCRPARWVANLHCAST